MNNQPIVLYEESRGGFYHNHADQFIAMSPNIMEAMSFKTIEATNEELKKLHKLAQYVEGLSFLSFEVKAATWEMVFGLCPNYVIIDPSTFCGYRLEPCGLEILNG